MAVIVKEINMPSNCDDCEFCIKDWDYDEAFCSASTHIQWRNLMSIPHNHRYQDCPLIEIPKESRLIDAIKMKGTIYGSNYNAISCVKEWIDAQTAIYDDSMEDF